MSDNKLAAEQAAGLRAIADMIEANPHLAQNFASTLNRSGLNVHVCSDDRAAEMGQIARIALRHGAKVDKDIDDTWHNLVMMFGTVKATVLAYRNEVCERVVTGTQTVTKTVKDPVALAAVPEVEVTEDVETVEWVCKPLLASDGGS
jgi:hypothetical protein